MAAVQEILVYITLGIAVVFLVRKFLLPKGVISAKRLDKGCGHEDCGCK